MQLQQIDKVVNYSIHEVGSQTEPQNLRKTTGALLSRLAIYWKDAATLNFGLNF